MTSLQVCPKCAGAKLTTIDLVASDVLVSCKSCGWRGKYKDLVTAEVKDMEPEKVAEDVSKEYLRLLAKYNGRPMGLSMIQAGIVGAKDPKYLSRLIRAACLGAHKATLDEIEKIQKELSDEARSRAH